MPDNKENNQSKNTANNRSRFFSDEQALVCSLDSEHALSFTPTTGGSNLVCDVEESNTPVEICLPVEIPYETIGAVSRFYETGKNTDKEGALVISTGKGDPGGKSYGMYQLSSKKETLQKFLSMSHYEEYFKDIKVGSKEFDDKWKALAMSDSKFISAQHEFIAETHYKPVAEVVFKEGVPLTLAVQSALWSMSVQHKFAPRIAKNAIKILSPSDKVKEGAIIKALYDARTNYVKSLKFEDLKSEEGKEKAREVILKRYSQEVNDVLKLTQPISNAPGSTLSLN